MLEYENNQLKVTNAVVDNKISFEKNKQKYDDQQNEKIVQFNSHKEGAKQTNEDNIKGKNYEFVKKQVKINRTLKANTK